ncbi:MAG: hypothetical protein NZ108_07795, partial [Bacteroidia bacterium]|nr:hypothetical protein [Bacteroidia bacterium]
MKRLFKQFSWVIFLLVGFITKSIAQPNYELHLEPFRGHGDTIFVNVKVHRDPGTPVHKFGTSNFVFEIHPLDSADLRLVPFSGGIHFEGPWSASVNPTSYDAMSFSQAFGNPHRFNLTIRKNFGGGGSGFDIPLDTTLIARVYFRLKQGDCSANLDFQWRLVNPQRGTVNDYDGNNLIASFPFNSACRVNPPTLNITPPTLVQGPSNSTNDTTVCNGATISFTTLEGRQDTFKVVTPGGVANQGP